MVSMLETRDPIPGHTCLSCLSAMPRNAGATLTAQKHVVTHSNHFPGPPWAPDPPDPSAVRVSHPCPTVSSALNSA